AKRDYVATVRAAVPDRRLEQSCRRGRVGARGSARLGISGPRSEPAERPKARRILRQTALCESWPQPTRHLGTKLSDRPGICQRGCIAGQGLEPPVRRGVEG